MGALADKVLEFIREVGVEAASEALGVSAATAQQWADGRKTPSLRAAELVSERDDPASEPPPSTGYEVNLGGSKLAILLPWYRSANPFTALSVLGMYDRAQMRLMMAHGDAFISHTRNRLAQLFMATDCEWSLMIDDDMILPWGKPAWFKEATGFVRMPDQVAGLHTIQRLVSHGKSLVGGLYVGKNVDVVPMFAEGCTSAEVRRATVTGTAERGCIPTKWVATGCLLIHRSVFADISKRYPHLDGGWFSPSEHDLVSGVDRALALLQEPSGDPSEKMHRALGVLSDCKARADAVSKLGTGEDVIFCHRATAAGHTPHVDTGLILGHVGNYTFGPSWVR